MTVLTAPDTERLIIAWLSPVIAASVAHYPDDPIPAAIVTRVSGVTDQGEFAAQAETIQVDILGGSIPEAQSAAMTANSRIRELNTRTGVIDLDGRIFAFDYVHVVQVPIRMDYDNPTIWRYVSRYGLGITHIAAGRL